MREINLPPWLAELEDEDLQFIKRFMLASGSLKDLAQQYGISYPTVRLRLDRLIEKIMILDQATSESPFQRRIKLLVAEGRLEHGVAKEILRAHLAEKKK